MVRLCTTPRASTPFAVGASEICVPERLFDALTIEERRCAIAHWWTASPHAPKPYPSDAKSLHDTLEVGGRTILYDLGLVYPGIPTLAGQPATAFPVGLTRAGLPIGLQAIGPYLEDRTPIRFAALLEREFGGFTPPPRFA